MRYMILQYPHSGRAQRNTPQANGKYHPYTNLQYPHSGRAQRNFLHKSIPRNGAACSTLTRVEPNAT